MSKLRIGILGLGNIAHQFAGDVTAPGSGGGSTRCTITAAASRSGEKSQQFCKQYGIEHACGDYQSLIAHPGVDSVYIALPNNLHLEWATKAMEQGKHVLCEKPIAMDADEAEQMFDVSRRTGCKLVEAFMYRCHPQTIAMVETVRSGAIGELKLIRSSFCFNVRDTAGNTRFDTALGGGALMDVGCYCIDLAMLLAGGAPASATATGRRHKSGVDVACDGLLMFRGGVMSTFSCAMDLQASNLAQVCGTEGYLDIPVPWKPPEVGARWTHQGMTPPKQDAVQLHVGGEDAGGPYAHEHSVDAGQRLYALEADAFARVVLEGEPPFVTEQETVARMRVLDDMRQQVGVRWD
ncbi:Gfo/Idh/MocA family oxidoreductase [Phycisphaeraceae bacterium D3-23]